jgi:hypothetical protein
MNFLPQNILRLLYHAYMIMWFILNLSIALGNWTGKIRFGHGMGDLIYIGIIGIVVLIVCIYYYINFKENSNTRGKLIIMAICFIFLIFITLKMTYWRGLESRWDGRVFF